MMSDSYFQVMWNTCLGTEQLVLIGTEEKTPTIKSTCGDVTEIKLIYVREIIPFSAIWSSDWNDYLSKYIKSVNNVVQVRTKYEMKELWGQGWK